VKRLGLLGGMSWESTAHYYRLLNESVRDRLGGAHSADLVIRSFDFDGIAAMQSEDRWAEAGDLLAGAAADLEAAGAEGILICANTMHLVADAVTDRISIPLLHIADATGSAIRTSELTKVLLLGTAFTMEQPFLRERLEQGYGLDVVVPDADDRAAVHGIIYDELVLGIVDPASRMRISALVYRLVAERGIEGVILGCTEFELLLGPDDLPVPWFPTTALHVAAAVEFALAPTAEQGTTSAP
jgi:aspartate racemase